MWVSRSGVAEFLRELLYTYFTFWAPMRQYSFVVDVTLDPTEAGLVGERGPDDKQAFVVAFFRKTSPSTVAGQTSRRRQRRSAEPGGATSSHDRQARRRRRYRANERPATAWSYHGTCVSRHDQRPWSVHVQVSEVHHRARWRASPYNGGVARSI